MDLVAIMSTDVLPYALLAIALLCYAVIYPFFLHNFLPCHALFLSSQLAHIKLCFAMIFIACPTLLFYLLLCYVLILNAPLWSSADNHSLLWFCVLCSSLLMSAISALLLCSLLWYIIVFFPPPNMIIYIIFYIHVIGFFSSSLCDISVCSDLKYYCLLFRIYYLLHCFNLSSSTFFCSNIVFPALLKTTMLCSALLYSVLLSTALLYFALLYSALL